MDKMTYSEFLNTCKVLRMLFGWRTAKLFFTENKEQFKVLDSINILNLDAQRKNDEGDITPHG